MATKVIDQLDDPSAHDGDPAEAFDVIVPSTPGFGWSTPLPDNPDMNFWKAADLFHKLMTEVLGHEKYAAAGSDLGSMVTTQLGHKYYESLRCSTATMPATSPADPLCPQALRRPRRRARPRLKHPRPRAERLPGRHAGLDPRTLDELEQQRRQRRERLQQGRHPHQREDLLGHQLDRHVHADVRQLQPLPVDPVPRPHRARSGSHRHHPGRLREPARRDHREASRRTEGRPQPPPRASRYLHRRDPRSRRHEVIGPPTPRIRHRLDR
ncbi:alpha/beta fold hydrolase [Streptomyces sp. SAS_270]|uniref:alpha/beta fold hydrolase n=1 Tax=Streptomyces sp. SAS_270 TaxID=3412748 RepID=UPI00403D4DAA